MTQSINSPDTFTQLFDAHEGHDLTIMSAQVQEPGNYRRIIRDNQGQIDHIVDFRNLTDSERNIREISLGIFCVNNELLFKYLPEFKDDTNTEEINLTQLVKIMKTNGHKIQSLRAEDYQEFMGVNDRFQLNTSMRWLQERINAQDMYNGVTIISPSDTYIGPDVIIEPDATIYPNTHIYGKSIIRSGATIYPNSWIENATIGENTTIDSSRITDSTVGAQTTIGPNAHIRMHSDIGNKVRIGNFVEMKNVIFEDLSRSAHLTYLGDAKVGKDVNIGCGVVTANYDGKNKYRTEIGSGSFIGSHSTLIAPVTIGENALVAAASVVSDDVEDGAMAIARTRQETKPGYGERFKNKEGK
ncbi:bifunctional UDP-N-acetylglucosamine diphosphorylase/glucosamine-1-phosphate N-acetyltransferase GlmU [Erysipelothrix sp. D19-032]